MRARAVAVVVGGLLSVGVVGVPAATGTTTTNQGDVTKVHTVDNPNVSCNNPVPVEKHEGDFGRTIWPFVWAPIDYVTVKSGTGAYVVESWFDTFNGKIKLSKDISNFIVWTCPQQNYN